MAAGMMPDVGVRYCHSPRVAHVEKVRNGRCRGCPGADASDRERFRSSGDIDDERRVLGPGRTDPVSP